MQTRWGKRLGRYEIVAELGRGTMGVVYKARDPKIHRFVAVKAISIRGQNAAEQRQYRERFFHEAQAAGRLLHAGIVTIFDVGEDPDTRDPYIVMELVKGQTLNQVFRETKTLPLDTALKLTEELAEALDYAHAQGVIHRDIKPANILITEDGHAKIADFGIAKMNLADLTLPGHVIGTPAYMSPEQLQDDPVDGRSDLFSLGAVLYSMLTGFSPFQGNSATTVCFKVANRDPLPASTFDLKLPPELDAVMSRALAKDPADRYQRGIQFALDLRELRERPPQPNAKVSTPAASDDTTATDTSSNVAHPQIGNSAVAPQWLRRQVSVNRALAVASLLLVVWIASLRKPPKQLFPVATPVAGVAGLENPPAASTPGPETPRPKSAAITAKTHAAKPQKANAPRAQGDIASKAAGVASLDIQVQHHFTDAKLTLWIDDKLVYSHSLHGENKNHLLLLRDVKGSETAKLQVPAGEHSLRVHGQSSADSFDESKTITATFAKDAEQILRIDFDKHNREMRISLH